MKLFYVILTLALSFTVKAQNELREYTIDSVKQDLYMTKVMTNGSVLYKNKTITFDYKSFKIPTLYGGVLEYKLKEEPESNITLRDNNTMSFYNCLNSSNQECLLQLVSPPTSGKNLVELYVSDNHQFFIFYMKAKDEDYKNIRSKKGWIYMGASKDGDLHYIRNKYEERNDNYIKVWQKTIFKKEEIDGKTYYNVEELALEKFDCKTSRFLPVSLVKYDSQGKVLQSSDFSKFTEWADIVPETFLELKFNFVCSKFGK